MANLIMHLWRGVAEEVIRVVMIVTNYAQEEPGMIMRN